MHESFSFIEAFYADASKIDPMACAACPVCNSRKGHICWGYYWRYRPGTDQQEKIQRLWCKDDDCRRKTFSVLPHPFLPIVRFTLCTLLSVLILFEEGESISRLSRKTGVARSTVRRTIDFARRLRTWMDREAQTAPWALSPRPCPNRLWRSFTRSFSWAFYPARS